ncbi:GNAT family N-acetyltransferase [Saccharothrix sp. SC076]|nr:GNAT family N-acetyltransferase [Saccharothrix obliqua]
MDLTGPVLRALAAGDLAAANAVGPVPLTPYFAAPDQRPLWRLRVRQLTADPASAGWWTGVIWAEAIGLAVGHAGFHGPPDDDGLVEIGYAVDPEHRRRGYAGAALAVLLRRVAEDPAVRTVRLSIRPDNAVSRRLAARHGFVRTGEQWDEEDGLEHVFERPAR